MDYCFTFLSAGERFNKALGKRLRENPVFNKANLIITTDNPDEFRGLGKVFNFVSEKRERFFNFNLKRKAIRNAVDEGFSRIFYIDSDVEVFSWDEDFFIKEERGAFFRRYLKRMQHRIKYDFYEKIFRLSTWRGYKPVSEKIMYFNESADKIRAFTDTWEQLDLISKGHITPPSEGHEIRISCRINGIDVRSYKPDPFKKSGGNTMKDRQFNV